MKIKPANATAGLPGSGTSYLASLIPDNPPDPAINLTPAQRAQAADPKPAHIPPANRLTPRARDLFFDPPPEIANQIFSALLNPYFSFANTASEHNTTLEALSAWLARPDIAERIDNLTGALASRLRLITVDRLHHAVDACTIILQEYKDAACHEAGIREGRAGSADEHNRRDRETARKTSILMLRFARFDPLAHKTRARAGTDNTHRGQVHVISPNSTTITLSNPYAPHPPAPSPHSATPTPTPDVSTPAFSPLHTVSLSTPHNLPLKPEISDPELPDPQSSPPPSPLKSEISNPEISNPPPSPLKSEISSPEISDPPPPPRESQVSNPEIPDPRHAQPSSPPSREHSHGANSQSPAPPDPAHPP